MTTTKESTIIWTRLYHTAQVQITTVCVLLLTLPKGMAPFPTQARSMQSSGAPKGFKIGFPRNKCTHRGGLKEWCGPYFNVVQRRLLLQDPVDKHKYCRRNVIWTIVSDLVVHRGD
jgi:hypothetical protein